MNALTTTLALLLLASQYTAAQEIPREVFPLRVSVVGKSYLKGTVSEATGNDYLEPTSILSWGAGVEYLPKITNSLYGIVGVQVGLEPAISYKSYPEAQAQSPDFAPFKMDAYGFYSVSIPLGFGFENRLKNQQWALFFEGSFIPMYYVPGGSGTNHYYRDENDSQKLSLRTRVETTQDGWYYQAQVATGISHHSQVGRVALRLIYHHTFQNMMEGGYRFYDQDENPSSEGKYSLSGKYIGLALSYSPNKSLKKTKAPKAE
jgi:hypothetical protein